VATVKNVALAFSEQIITHRRANLFIFTRVQNVDLPFKLAVFRLMPPDSGNRTEFAKFMTTWLQICPHCSSAH